MLRRRQTPMYPIFDRSRSKRNFDTLQRLDDLGSEKAREPHDVIVENETSPLVDQDDRGHGQDQNSDSDKDKDNEMQNNEDEDDEDFEDDDDDAKRKTSRSSPTGRRRGRPAKKPVRTVPSDNEDEEDEEDDDPGELSEDEYQDEEPTDSEDSSDHVLDSDDETGAKARKRPLSRRKPVAKKPRGRSTPKKDLDDFIADDDEDFETYQPMTRSKPRRASSGVKKAKRKIVDNDDSSEEEEQSEEKEAILTTVFRGSKGQSASTRRNILARRKASVDDSDSDSDSCVSEPRTARRGRAAATRRKESSKSTSKDAFVKSRPRRSSATKAIYKMKRLNGTSGNDNDEESVSNPSSHGRRPSNEILSSDEEFLADSASEQSDMKEIGYTDSEDEEDDVGSAAPRKAKAVNIDKDDIGSADESSGDELDNEDSRDTLSAKGSKLDEIRPSPAAKRHPQSYDSSDDDGARYSPTLKWFCPSTDDAITLEALPKIHVCYVSPDGNSRQCFAIETLRQITLKSFHRASRTAIDGSQQDTFLQPPHFRTPMSADLLDQIASRFGRDALDLHGEFFKRKDLARPGPFDTDDFMAFFGESRQDYGEQFEERVTKYINGMMGAKDIYCCCLCYSEMHRRIVNLDEKRHAGKANESGSQSSDDEQFLKLAADSEYDPMTVLGWLDNDKYAAASCFCFGKVASLKRHLRDDHNVQIDGIVGNDLYQRYRVRGTDGLLQRFLHSHWKRSHHSTFQGAMQRYWFDGANQSFVCLLEMIDHAEAFRDVLASRNTEDDIREEAETFFEVARTFFESFQNRAQTEWEQISSPFHKDAQNDDLKDFLTDNEGEEIVEDEYPHFLSHRQLQPEDDSDPNDLVHKLERKYAKGNPEDSSVGEEDELSVSSVLNGNGYYSVEEAEPKDEWVASIESKRRKFLDSDKPSSSSKRLKATPRGKKLTRKKGSTPQSGSLATSPATSTPASRHRSIQESSSDDEFT